MTPARQRTLIILLIFLGVVIAGFFGMRSLRAVRQYEKLPPPPLLVSDSLPTETNVDLVRGWMTIGFLSRTYQLPPRLLYDALAISPKGNDDKSLEQLNEEYFPDRPGYVLETVRAAIRTYQARPGGPLSLTEVPPSKNP